MSRSFKKTAGWADSSPWFKNYANRVVRRQKLDPSIVNGKGYKKMYNSYDICDYKFLYYSETEVDREIADDKIPYVHRHYPWSKEPYTGICWPKYRYYMK